MNQPPLILFDGICNFCCGWVQFLIRMDTKAKFLFATIQSESGQKVLISYRLPVETIDTVIYIKDNEYYRESSAVLEILKELGGLWKVFVVFKLIPKAIRDRIYRFIAAKRYTLFGKRSTCLLPTEALQKRFLS